MLHYHHLLLFFSSLCPILKSLVLSDGVKTDLLTARLSQPTSYKHVGTWDNRMTCTTSNYTREPSISVHSLQVEN